jgi:hypothetical protein
MLKNHLSFLIAGLLLLGPAAQMARAGQQEDKQPATVEQIKAKVAKLGLGEKAKATIRLKDGTKTKGYIARDGEEDFVIRDRKTDAPTTISYADVARVESNRGHSTAKHIAIGVGIGVGAFVAVLLIIFARLD